MWMLAVLNSDELIYIWSPYTCSDCRSSLEVFPGLSRTLSFNFQDFPGPKWFFRTFQVLEFSTTKIQDFPGGVGTLMNNLSPLHSIFDESQQTISWQPSPLHNVITPMHLRSSSSPLTLYYYTCLIASFKHDLNCAWTKNWKNIQTILGFFLRQETMKVTVITINKS